MATTILVYCVQPVRSRLLSIIPVIVATRGRHPRLSIWESLLRSKPSAVPNKKTCRFVTAEKLLFHIGGTTARQSRRRLLTTANGKSCRRAERSPPQGC